MASSILRLSEVRLRNSYTGVNFKINMSEAICPFQGWFHTSKKANTVFLFTSSVLSKDAAILKALPTDRCIGWTKFKIAPRESIHLIELSPDFHMIKHTLFRACLHSNDMTVKGQQHVKTSMVFS